jgi:hypothetical protein
MYVGGRDLFIGDLTYEADVVFDRNWAADTAVSPWYVMGRPLCEMRFRKYLV